MKAASQVGKGEGEGPRQLVSPLEQTLDAAVESERHRWVRSARERSELMRVTPHPGRAHASWGLEAVPLGELRPAQLPASEPARQGTPAKPKPLRRQGTSVSGWVQLSAVALGALAILIAFQLPLSTTLPGPARELAALPPRPAPAPEHASDPPAPAVAVTTTVEPPRVPAESVSQPLLPRPSEPSDGASALPMIDSATLRSEVAAVSPARVEPPRPSAAPAAQRAQAGAGQAVPAKRANVVTVNDVFGIGGDEPLPPEALEDPIPAVPPPPSVRKPTRAAPAAPSALFYQKAPF